MSYDLHVQPDENFSQRIDLAHIANFLVKNRYIKRHSGTAFVYENKAGTRHIEIDLGDTVAEEKAIGHVNVISLRVPAAFSASSVSHAVRLAFAIADHLGWKVFDPQSDSFITEEESAQESDEDHEGFGELFFVRLGAQGAWTWLVGIVLGTLVGGALIVYSILPNNGTVFASIAVGGGFLLTVVKALVETALVAKRSRSS